MYGVIRVSRAIFQALLVSSLLTACGNSQKPASSSAPGSSLPVGSKGCRNFNAERNPYFGDLHVHTTYSLDANTQDTRTKPHDSYRFALGERLGVQPFDANGQPTRFTQISRPLDFAAVTDHSEFLGETQKCTNSAQYSGDTPGTGYNSSNCNAYRSNPDSAFVYFNLLGPGNTGTPQPDGSETIARLPDVCGADGSACLLAAKDPWTDIQQAAEAFYDRSSDCSFTTFVGYEWTGSPQSNNLHRNVIFESEVVPALPVSYYEAAEPELLWKSLDAACTSAAGCNYLTIPHNSNLSAGLMFQTQYGNNGSKKPFDAAYAQARQHNEPLVEIMQHKGQSECNNAIAGAAAVNDELCGFELLPYNNLTGNRIPPPLATNRPPKEQDFLRDTLKVGLQQEQALGVNPFKYGFIGSTDTHLGTPGNSNESHFPGHAGAGQNPRNGVPGLTDAVEVNPGGLAVVWAEQNTRESLFSAMRRRETYGTSGTRPIVRFFGGWNLPLDQCQQPDFAGQGYANGVPMGSDLPALPSSPAAAAPRFAVSALRDPGNAMEPTSPLQRIQIIKGWVDSGGAKHEQVYEVAGDPHNGAGVDLSTCEGTGSGFASLCAVWQDPNFDASQSAFYYARVVENPSCRWVTRQCLAANINCNSGSVPSAYAGCCDTSYPKTVQERAWTSPIWFRPAGG